MSINKIISFFDNNINSKLKDRKVLKKFIGNLIIQENFNFINIDIIFCTDDFLLELNKSVLQHDYYTDIITFDLSEINNSISAEIYISVDRVMDNASIFKVDYINELHRVIFHGILHLCGYKDKTASQIATMRSKEQFYLDKYFK